MSPYDNEIYRGPPEPGPTLEQDICSYGTDIYIVTPPQTTAQQDAPATKEPVRQDSKPVKKKKSRIAKAIKMLASCMAAVVITEAATNIAATVEPPAPEAVPAGQYYAGQWPGVEPVHDGVYHTDMEADMGYSIQIPMDGKVWRLTAGSDWRMCWFEGNGYGAYIDLKNQKTGVYLVAELSLLPHDREDGEDSYTELTTPTGETLYVRAFFLDFGKYAEEYGLDRDMMEESAEIRQALVDDFFAGIRVSAGTEDGWQGLQIGDCLYSQQGPEWYGVGGFGNLEIHIPWVHYAADYNLQNMTPYSRVNVNGITWSIYFTENDTYLWAVPNIEPELCLGGLTARFMCADAVRRGEYINDEEWLEMGGFTSVSQRQTAVDILVECLQHHYALRDGRYPRDWPWKGPIASQGHYQIWAESLQGTWIQFSFGNEAYRIDSTDSNLRFHWDRTVGTGNEASAELEISNMAAQQENWSVILTIRKTEFRNHDPERVYVTTQGPNGETLYLRFNAKYRIDGPTLSVEELQNIANHVLTAVKFRANPDDSGWSTVLLCDSMHSPQTMEWSGSGIVGSTNEIQYIRLVEVEGLHQENPCEIRSYNGIAWSFYYDVEEEIIWAVPDIEPNVCIGAEVRDMHLYYREKHPSAVTDGWNSQYNVPADDVNHAVDAFSEALSHIYPLGMEPSVNIPAPEVTTPTDQPETEPTTEATTEATEVPLTTEVETYEFTYPDNPEITETGTEIRYYDRNGELVKSEFHTYWNDQLCRQGLSDEQNQVYIIEEFEYHENGTLRDYWVYYFEDASKLQSFEYFEAYNEEYDEGGTVIDTDHCIYDPERDLWVVEDYETDWDLYADGLFSVGQPSDDTQLYEGVFRAKYAVYWEIQRNADGSGTEVLHDSDGSLISTNVITVDEEANTWTKTTYHHRRDSDYYPYRNEYQVEFDDNGNVIRYSFRQDDEGQGFWTIDSEVRFGDLYEVEYDDAGRRIEYYYTEEGYVPESWMFCFDEWGRVKSFDGVYQD